MPTAPTTSTRTRTFRLPDVGEGLTEAEIVRWLVAEGEVVAVNAPIVEIETAKSLVELPSPWSGRVERLLVPEGLTVDVGTEIIAVGVEGGEGEPADGADQADGAGSDGAGGDGAASAVVDVRDGSSGSSSVLVGYGVRPGAAGGRRRRRGAVAVPELERAVDPESAAPVEAGPEGAPVEDAVPSAPARPAPTGAAGAARPLAKPPVRVLARDLGVDLADVPASGAGGVVTRADVLAHAGQGPAAAPAEPAAPGAQAGQPVAAAAPPGASSAELIEAAASGARETRVPIRGVRKVTAQQMVASAFTAPQATAFVTVDATRTVRLLDRLREDRAFAGVHVSPLLVIARALCLAIARHPEINAAWDEARQEIVVKHYVNLGIAVATPRGLMVPNVKDAQAMDLYGLAGALTGLVKTARAGRSTPADLAQGTISITNVGVFGVDTGTPILNPGEAAILCVGAVTQRPWVHKGKVKPRWVVQLSLTLDHRVVDGDLGSRFLADVGALLERPDRALLWA